MSFSFSFGTPWALALLGVVPLLWLAARRTRTNLSRRHLRMVTLVRSIALILLVLALARPMLSADSEKISVVYALDVSHSVAAGFVEEAIGWIERAQGRAGPASARIVAFGDRAVLLESPAEVRTIEVGDLPGTGALSQSDTDLERGLEIALSALERDRIKRVVLLSDGNQTRGDVWRMLPALRDAGVRVYPMPARPRDARDAWIGAIDLPDRMRDGEPLSAQVSVFTPVETRGSVTLYQGARRLGQRTLTLAAGMNPVSFEVTLRGAGATTLSAEVSVVGDSVAGNDRLQVSAWVDEKPRILYAEGREEASRFLAGALRSQGLVVETRAARDLPASVAALERYDAVILSDVPAKQMSGAQMQAVERYVRDTGGGLLFAGGENTFGEDGYSGSPLEAVLPIEFKAREKRKDLALVIAIDRSYSMKGRKMEYAKEAARAALDLLEEQHRIAVVAFDSQPYVSARVEHDS